MKRLILSFAFAAIMSAQQRPPITGVSHIALKAKSFDAAFDFYVKYLGIPWSAPNGPVTGKIDVAVFQVNEHQYIEVTPDLKSDTESRLSHVAFMTTDVKKMREYLVSKGVEVLESNPCRVKPGSGIAIRDVEGHVVEFVEPSARELPAQPLGVSRISDHIGHVGFTVNDREAADRLYRDILGLHEVWHGGMTDDGPTNWVAMRVPDGMDHLEYMLNVQNPSPRTLGVMNHLCLVVDNVDESYKALLARGGKIAEGPKVGRDGKRQLNLYDPDLTRAELMEPRFVQKPCCAPYLDK